MKRNRPWKNTGQSCAFRAALKNILLIETDNRAEYRAEIQGELKQREEVVQVVEGTVRDQACQCVLCVCFWQIVFNMLWKTLNLSSLSIVPEESNGFVHWRQLHNQVLLPYFEQSYSNWTEARKHGSYIPPCGLILSGISRHSWPRLKLHATVTSVLASHKGLWETFRTSSTSL